MPYVIPRVLLDVIARLERDELRFTWTIFSIYLKQSADQSQCHHSQVFSSWYSMHPLKHRVKRNIQPDWLTSEILDIMNERDKCKKNGNLELYKTLRNRVSFLIRKSKQATYQ